jgi:hypothetical protein
MNWQEFIERANELGYSPKGAFEVLSKDSQPKINKPKQIKQQLQNKHIKLIKRAIYNIKTGSLYLAEMDLRKILPTKK